MFLKHRSQGDKNTWWQTRSCRRNRRRSRPGKNIQLSTEQWNVLLNEPPRWKFAAVSDNNWPQSKYFPSTCLQQVTRPHCGRPVSNHYVNATTNNTSGRIQTDAWPRLVLGDKIWELDQPVRQTHVWTPCQLGRGHSIRLQILMYEGGKKKKSGR